MKNHNYLFDNSHAINGITFGNNRTIYDEILANRYLNDIIEQINTGTFNGEPFSPFEKYIMAYLYVSSKVYKNTSSIVEAREVTHIMTGDNIVCTGYSNLLKYICDNIGIECQCQDYYLHHNKQDSIEGHTNLTVYIKDDKYNINGIFYSDACFDSVKMGTFAKNYYCPFLNFCLLDFKDKDKLLHEKLTPAKEDERGNTEWLRNMSFYHEWIEKHQTEKDSPQSPTCENFVKALCITQGMSKEEAKKYVNLNARRARTLFQNNAQNCFFTTQYQEEIVPTL